MHVPITKKITPACFACLCFIFSEHLIYDIFFSPIRLKRVKGMKPAQMFFEDCVGPSKSAI